MIEDLFQWLFFRDKYYSRIIKSSLTKKQKMVIQDCLNTNIDLEKDLLRRSEWACEHARPDTFFLIFFCSAMEERSDKELRRAKFFDTAKSTIRACKSLSDKEKISLILCDKFKACFKRLKKKWDEKIKDSKKEIPLNDEKYIDLIIELGWNYKRNED